MLASLARSSFVAPSGALMHLQRHAERLYRSYAVAGVSVSHQQQLHQMSRSQALASKTGVVTPAYIPLINKSSAARISTTASPAFIQPVTRMVHAACGGYEGKSRLEMLQHVSRSLPPLVNSQSNPKHRGRMSSFCSYYLTLNCVTKAVASLLDSDDLADLSLLNVDPRWLGNPQYVELHEYVWRQGGTLKPCQIRAWLLSKEGRRVLECMNITPEELSTHDIDHIDPVCKGGHASDSEINYFVMPREVNRSFGGVINSAKINYVGIIPWLAVLVLRAVQLLSTGELQTGSPKWEVGNLEGPLVMFHSSY